MRSVDTSIVDVSISNKHYHTFFALEKLREIICCKTQSEHAFSCKCVWLVMHCLFVFVFSFDICCQSVNGPTLRDYKLQNPIEHVFIDWRIIKEVV